MCQEVNRAAMPGMLDLTDIFERIIDRFNQRPLLQYVLESSMCPLSIIFGFVPDDFAFDHIDHIFGDIGCVVGYSFEVS